LLEIKGIKIPLDRSYYNKDGTHIWLKTEKNHVQIGMDAFAVEMAGTINFINVNKKQVKRGEEIGSYESHKFVKRLYSPMNGEIISVNKQVIRNPQLINKHPYDSWIVVIKPDDNEWDYKYIIKGKNEILKWISKEIGEAEREN